MAGIDTRSMDHPVIAGAILNSKEPNRAQNTQYLLKADRIGLAAR
jgi:hypothetical protein